MPVPPIMKQPVDSSEESEGEEESKEEETTPKPTENTEAPVDFAETTTVDENQLNSNATNGTLIEGQGSSEEDDSDEESDSKENEDDDDEEKEEEEEEEDDDDSEEKEDEDEEDSEEKEDEDEEDSEEKDDNEESTEEGSDSSSMQSSDNSDTDKEGGMNIKNQLITCSHNLFFIRIEQSERSGECDVEFLLRVFGFILRLSSRFDRYGHEAAMQVSFDLLIQSRAFNTNLIVQR